MELAKVIRDLREELERAIATGEGETLRFELGPVELELSVAIEAGTEVGAKARFWVAELGAQGTVERSTGQRIKLLLTPRLGPDGRTPLVSGRAEERER
jgi:hypothetical protein